LFTDTRQNSFYPAPDNLANVMVHHLRRVIPGPKVLLSITPRAGTGSVTLFLVIWTMGPWSYYNGFKRTEGEYVSLCWQEDMDPYSYYNGFKRTEGEYISLCWQEDMGPWSYYNGFKRTEGEYISLCWQEDMGPWSYHNGFKRTEGEYINLCWREETPNFMIPQKLEVIRRPKSGEG